MPRRNDNGVFWLIAIAVLVWWLSKGNVTTPAPANNVTAVTFVYEKDESAVPEAVRAALNTLNREREIVATVFDDDIVDGTGETPDQYKAALAEARKVGMPVLVVMAGDKVVATVKNPQTEADVLEAVK